MLHRILDCLALKRDAVYKSVMETVDHVMVINEKDFDEALDFAIQKRKFLILQAYQKAKQMACKDGKEWAQEE